LQDLTLQSDVTLINPVNDRLTSEVDVENSSSSFPEEPRLQLRVEAIRPPKAKASIVTKRGDFIGSAC